MQTQVMHEPAVGQPWLEYCPPGADGPEQIVLDGFPFSIGRNDATNLPLLSTRVSREHAVIVREGEVYRVRDLGSTNGTFLNGQRVHEAPLSDGDILLVADVELSFFCGHSRLGRGAATQVIDLPASQGTGADAAAELVREARRLHEVLTHRAVESFFQPVIDLETGKVLGYEVADDQGGAGRAPAARQAVLALDCRLTARLRALRRLVAVEDAAAFPGDVRVFAALDPAEIGAAGLVESLGRLRAALAPGQRLVVGLPESAVSDSPYACRLRGQLREMGIGIEQASGAVGELDLAQAPDFRPDFLRLPPALVGGIDRNPQRKRQAEAVVEAARKLGCEAIAAGVQTQLEAGTCRALGCRYGQGDFFGSPKPLGSWIASAGRSTGTG